MTATSNSERQSNMNRVIRFLTGIIVLSAMAACSKADPSISDPTMLPGNIHGFVTDEDGSPINHIKVTLTQSAFPLVVYTSSRGEFIADMALTEGPLEIMLEDIDGEENGGAFAPLSDTITVLEDLEMITLEYSLTLATASENTPQL